MTDVTLTQLATVAGLAAFLKWLVIPFIKMVAPRIQGRETVIAVFGSAVVLRLLAVWALPSEPNTAAQFLEAGLQALVAAATAIGLQETMTAALRSEQA